MTRQRAEDQGLANATAKDRIKDIADTASNKAQALAGKVTDQAEEYLDLAQQYGEKAQEAAQQFKSYIDKSLKEQPMATLATAAVVGFVLGAIWKR